MALHSCSGLRLGALRFSAFGYRMMAGCYFFVRKLRLLTSSGLFEFVPWGAGSPWPAANALASECCGPVGVGRHAWVRAF